MKIALNPFKYRYHSLRQTITQPLVWMFFFLGPLLDVFRLDMIHLKMIFLGQAYPLEVRYLMWIPIVFFGGVILIGIISFVWGRLFCGWACPHNTLTELTRPFRAVFGRDTIPLPVARLYRRFPVIKTLFGLFSLPLAFVLTAGFSVLLSFFIVPPDWVAAQYASFRPHVALVFGHGLFTLLGIFLLYAGHDFCRNACPYGMCQSLSAYQEGKWQPMEVTYTGKALESDCKTCTACQTVCPVDIDPRKPENLRVGQFYGCFNCGECIDACKTVFKTRSGSGLLSFQHAWQRQSSPAPQTAQQHS